MKFDKPKRKSIRTTTLIIVIVALIFQIAAVYFVLKTFTLKSIAGLEYQYATEHMIRVEKIFDYQLQQLSQEAFDLCFRGRAYEYIKNENKIFIDESSHEKVFSNLQLDAIALVDSSGKYVFTDGVDLENKKNSSLSKNFISYIDNSTIKNNKDSNHKIKGLIMLPEGLMMISSYPVTRIEGSGIVYGNLIVGKYIDNEEIAFLSGRLDMKLKIERLDQMDSSRLQVFNSIKQEWGIEIRELNKNIIEAYSIVNDVYGKPIIGISIERPLEIRSAEQRGAYYLIFLLIFVSSIFAVLIVIFIDKKINLRLVELSKEVRYIGNERTFSVRLKQGRTNDEITVVSDEINNMLDKLEKAQTEIMESKEALRKSNEDLEKKVNERTLELSILNEGLKGEISERKKIQKKIEYLAYHDCLTNLPNRMFFSEQLRNAIVLSEHMDEKLAIMFLDMDGFKNINDTLGHSAGDQLLEQLSRRLIKSLRKTDIVARIGGDEFIIMIENAADAEEVRLIADKIINCINKPFVLNNEHFYVSASIGISMYPEDGRDAETLINNADIAMYRAKEKGRNQFVLYSQA